MSDNINLSAALASARTAQATWQQLSVEERLRVVARALASLAAAPQTLADKIERVRAPGQSLAAEVLPLLASMEWHLRHAPKILAPENWPWWQSPLWLLAPQTTTQFDARGVVGVIAPSNYPLLLGAVPALQALVAGNAVLLKPTENGVAALVHWQQALVHAGLPAALCQILPSDAATGAALAAQPLDLLVLTGSAATGRAVLAAAAAHLTPCIMELSGLDAVVVLPDADAALVADALRFGLTFNDGATCMAPRRLILVGSASAHWPRWQAALRALPAIPISAATAAALPAWLEQVQAVGGKITGGKIMGREISQQGEKFMMQPALLELPRTEVALLAQDWFAPLLLVEQVANSTAAIAAVAACPYGLAASVFGPTGPAQHVAEKLPVGTVTINDLIAGTADPRLSFGGRGRAGFGVTRGRDGLRAMTIAKNIIRQPFGLRPHLAPPQASDAGLFAGLIQWRFGAGVSKQQGLQKLMQAGRGRALPPRYRV